MTKAFEYSYFSDWLGNCMLLATGTTGPDEAPFTANLVCVHYVQGDDWKARRRLLTPAFHLKILSSFFGTFNEQSRILVSDLQRAVNKSQEIDIFPFIVQTALDIICGSILSN